jgi:hypothetical protein
LGATRLHQNIQCRFKPPSPSSSNPDGPHHARPEWPSVKQMHPKTIPDFSPHLSRNLPRKSADHQNYSESSVGRFLRLIRAFHQFSILCARLLKQPLDKIYSDFVTQSPQARELPTATHPRQITPGTSTKAPPRPFAILPPPIHPTRRLQIAGPKPIPRSFR